jgi:MFS family permease
MHLCIVLLLTIDTIILLRTICIFSIDWLQGPYFYEVYSTKVFNGVPATLDLVSKLFLVGFASTGIFGPWIGRFVDTIGRKAGTLAFAVLYAIGALSTRSNVLGVLLLGRLTGGLGTSLLFSAPEAWLVGEHQKNKFDGRWLGETFGLAYAGDSLVAITAGQLASLTANAAGPSGPFTLSVVFLFLGGLLALLKWDENVAVAVTTTTTTTTTSVNSNASSSSSVVATHDSNGRPSKDSSPLTATATSASVIPPIEEAVNKNKKPSILDAIDLISKDKRIMLLGAVQALFEGGLL